MFSPITALSVTFAPFINTITSCARSKIGITTDAFVRFDPGENTAVSVTLYLLKPSITLFVVYPEYCF
ncbi:Uncharacterised protein [uncultured archaeon]|nr:Uncharacterised protein [uncultured archaeon]